MPVSKLVKEDHTVGITLGILAGLFVVLIAALIWIGIDHERKHESVTMPYAIWLGHRDECDDAYVKGDYIVAECPNAVVPTIYAEAMGS